MKNCPFCNSPMEDGAKFCTNCGQKVEATVNLAESAAVMTYGNEPTAPTPAPIPTPAPAPTPTPMSAPTGPAGSTPGMTYGNQQTGTYTQQRAGQPVGDAAYIGQQAGQNGFNGQQTGGPNAYGGQQGMQGGFHPAMGGVQHPGMAQPAKKNLVPLFIIGGVALIAVIAVIVLFVTGVFGGKKGDKNDPNLGDYKAVALEMMGMVLDPKEFSEDEMVITLNAGGKAVILTGSDKSSGTWTLDGDKFTLKGGGLDETGTLKDGVMKLPDLGGMGADWTFSKDGKPVSGLNTTSLGDDGLLGAIGGNTGEITESSEPDPSANTAVTGGNFSSPTTEITWPSDWYGWCKITDMTGDLKDEYGSEMFIDIFALFDTYEGRPYFEAYETPDYASEGDSPIITFYVNENPLVLEPDGTDGAYLLDMELTDNELFDIQTSMYGGKINFTVDYEYGNSTATFEFFIREYEAPWDESQDTLPPGYDIYCK